jgi:cholinesterase
VTTLKMRLSSTLIPVLNLPTVSQGDWAWVKGPQVQTTSGIYTGRPNPNVPQVSEYLGIPYGQDTSGANRFLAPKAINTPSHKAYAKSFVSPAILSAGGVSGS